MKNFYSSCTICLLASVALPFLYASPIDAQNENPQAVLPQPTVGEPLPGLTPEQLQRFEEGKEVFGKPFVPEEGLGPIFNQSSCRTCHSVPEVGGSHFPSGTTVPMVIRFGKKEDDGTFNPLEDRGGSLLQASTALFTPTDPCRERVPTEANVQTNRNTPITFGSGLIEAIADEALLRNADPEDNNKDGIRGTPHMVRALEDLPGSPLRVGRFGWKAQMPTLLSFSADALNNEGGISNELLVEEQRPNAPASASDGQLPCDDGVPDPDDRPNPEGIRIIDQLRDFMLFLAPPPQTPKFGMRGEQIFINLGCASCHIPFFTTSKNENLPILNEKQIKVYSDFLLHDMGELGDGIQQGDAHPTQIKTPPLWGLIHHSRFLHDGRFGTGLVPGFQPELIDVALDETIMAHGMPGSEAQSSAQQYAKLSAEQKNDLLAFLKSLGRREFDPDNNNVIDLENFNAFRNCYQQQKQDYDPDHPCAISDINQDRNVNQIDLDSLKLVYRTPFIDCNCNAEQDITEILDNPNLDQDNNAIPDGCSLAPSFLYTFDFETIREQRITGELHVINLRASDQVEFFYSFEGEGTGPAFANTCINLNNPQSLGVFTAVSDGHPTFPQYDVRIHPVIFVPKGTTRVSFQATVLNGGSKTLVVTEELSPRELTHFLRGDANTDKKVNLADPIFILQYLFRNGSRPSCLDAADANDDDTLDISDAVRLLLYLFVSSSPPLSAPFPDLGPDPSSGDLTCDYYPQF